MSDYLLKGIIPKKEIYSPIEIFTKENVEFLNYKNEFRESYYLNRKTIVLSEKIYLNK